MSKELRIAVRREYFELTKVGKKPFEYRLNNEYWRKRLVDRHYDTLVITLGYPKANDESRILRFPYRGYEMQTRQHKEFGEKPVEVFAIRQEQE